MSNLNNIYNSLTYQVKNKGKSSITSGDELEILLERDGKKITFEFHDNKYNDSSLGDWVCALIADAIVYEDLRDKDDLKLEFALEDYSEEAIDNLYKKLRANHEKANRIFTKEEQLKIFEEETC